jgi:DNA polymerase-3 subunit delta'
MSDEITPPELDRVAGYPHPRETRALYGQEAAERAFLAAWAEGRLHHGWLIRGPRGTGKATLAYRIARALIAEGPGEQATLLGPAVPMSLDPPEGCPVAARIRAQSEPRLRVLRRTINPQTGRMRTQIVIDDVREVRRFLALSAPDGGWRAVIVDAADEMNSSAANALLKVLEEPPPRTALLLVAHAPARLLPTIRSRCRGLDLRPLDAEDLRRALAGTGVTIGPDEAHALAILADGSVGQALRLAAGGGVRLYGRIVGALREGRGVDRPAMAALADEAAQRGAEARYELTGRLVLTLLGRLARHAAGGSPAAELAPGEAALLRAAARSPAQAALWAEAACRIGAALSHARAVNLDPGLTIIDTFLDLDATLARAREAG